MSKPQRVIQAPGWWKVVDERGDFGYYEFREDGRARALRGAWWDWCYVQGTWTSMANHEEWLRFADMDEKPTAVVGQPGFLEGRKAYYKAEETRAITDTSTGEEG